MKKTVKPRLKPSQRMKKRYMLFKYSAGKALFADINTLLKKLGVGYLKLIEFHPENGEGIVKCDREKAGAVRKALNEIGLKTLKTSGSLKKIRGMR